MFPLAHSRGPLNAAQLADTVVKAVHWSDGGSEFVFMDGTVMSFVGDMNSFVAVSASEKTRRDLMVTSLCLSIYENKVRAALHVFNTFSARPRLIHGLCASQEMLWSRTSPIESLVLSKDLSLFSREWCSAPEAQSLVDAARDSPLMYAMRLECAMKKVSLWVHPNRSVFRVSWPARVTETDGSSSLFVSTAVLHQQGNSSNGNSVNGHYSTQRTCRYVQLEQWFFVEACPAEWRSMLDLCFDLDKEAGMQLSSATDSNMSSSVTPTPLGAPIVPVVPSSAATYQSPYTALLTSQRPSVRFSELQSEDAHAFVAAAHIHNCPAQGRLHASAVPGTSVMPSVEWRLDIDPSGRTPTAIYRNLRHALLSSGVGSSCSRECCLLAFVAEDDSVVRATLGDAQAPNFLTFTTSRIALKREVCSGEERSEDAPAPVPQAVVTIEERSYVQNFDLSIPLPKTINTGICAPVLGNLGARALCTAATQSHKQYGGFWGAYTRLVEEGGRYLPFVGETVVSLVSHSYAQQSAVQVHPHLAHTTHEGDEPPSFVPTPQVVRFTSRIDGVGSFAALTNGVVRAVFDDRVILTLIPDAYDSDEGLVCELRGRDGVVHATRVAQCNFPSHEAYVYLQYLLPFRNFARMTSMSGSACVSTSAADVELSSASHYAPNDSYHASESEKGHVLGRHALLCGEHSVQSPSDLDVLVMHTSSSISYSQALRARSLELLKTL